MKRIIRLTERDLTRIVKRVINEQTSSTPQAAIELNNNTVVKLYGNYSENDQKIVQQSPITFTITTSPTTTPGLDKKVLAGGGLTITALVDCNKKKITSLSANANSVPETALLNVFDAQTQTKTQIDTPLKGKSKIQSYVPTLLTDKTVSANTFCKV